MANQLSNSRQGQSANLSSTSKLKYVHPLFQIIVLVFIFLLESTVLHAGDSKSEQGNWFFDKKPEKKLKKNPDNKLVSLRKHEHFGKTRYYASNRLGGEVELFIDFLRRDNVSNTLDLPSSVILPPLSETLVMEIKPTRRFSSMSYKLSYTYFPGKPNAKIRELQYYQLPFPKSERYIVSQGFNGRFSHFSDYTRYAVDIAMPEGAAIHSASDGVVMSIDEDFNNGGARRSLVDKANVLRIIHSDGSMAIYAHLQTDSVAVKIGQRIKRGQFIARAGSTGFSTGPHLHFAIEKNIGMKLISIPFKFKAEGKWVTPETGDLLIH